MRFVTPTLVAALACAVAGTSGCTDTNAPSPPLNGSFALTMLDQRALPDTIAASPPPSGPGCAIMQSSGTRVLDAATGSFTITLKATNACAPGEWVYSTETGSYTQRGSVLTLTEPYDQHGALSGRVTEQTIVVDGLDHQYTFAR